MAEVTEGHAFYATSPDGTKCKWCNYSKQAHDVIDPDSPVSFHKEVPLRIQNEVVGTAEVSWTNVEGDPVIVNHVFTDPRVHAYLQQDLNHFSFTPVPQYRSNADVSPSS